MGSAIRWARYALMAHRRAENFVIVTHADAVAAALPMFLEGYDVANVAMGACAPRTQRAVVSRVQFRVLPA